MKDTDVKVVRIEQWPEHPTPAQLGEWREKAIARIGKAVAFDGLGPWEYTARTIQEDRFGTTFIQSVWYTRTPGVECLFRIDSNFAKAFPDEPHILCPCSSVNFTIRYEGYSVVAKCSSCGTQDTIYSG